MSKESKEKKDKKSSVDKAEKALKTEKTETDENNQDISEKETEKAKKTDAECEGCKKLETELEKLKDTHMRCAAEYANYRSRTEKEKADIYTNATMDAVKNLLPIADSIDMAISSSGDAGEEYKKGLELIKAQLEKSFEALNITSFGEVGDAFDPQLYNAISKTEDDSLGENVVSAVFQKGYKCRDKIIRYCMVQVAN